MSLSSVNITQQRHLNQILPFSGVVEPVAESQAQREAVTMERAYFNTKQYLRVIKRESSNTERKQTKKTKKLLSDRLNNRYQSRTRLARLYDELGDKEKSKKLQRCSSFFNVLACPDGHVARKMANFHCQNRLCPDCSNRRGNRLFNKYEPIVNAFLRSRPELTVLHLVLTQAQIAGETPVQAHKRLVGTVKRLVDRDIWKNSFAGSLNSYEFTVSKRTHADGAIHYHAHLLVFCKLSVKERNKKWLSDLRGVWTDASKGKNLNLKVIPVTDLKGGLREILKYLIKPSDIGKFTVQHLAQVEQLRKRRMIATTGDFHNFVKTYVEEQPQNQAQNEPQTEREAITDGSPCPKCQKALSEVQMTIKQLIDFVRDKERRETQKE